MLISIIVPIYNVEKYIGRCLESIFVQETNDVDLECILVNDCTPDKSMEIVSKKLETYQGKINFIIKNMEKNGGLSLARNAGVKIAKGDYILFVDSDDRLQPDCLTYFIREKEKYGPDADVVLGNTFICKNGKPAMAFDKDDPILMDNTNGMALSKLMTRELYHTAWNKLVRRDYLLNYQIYFEKGIVDEDLLWSYLLFLNANKVLVLPRVTYIYEDNPGSIVNTTSKKIALTIQSRIIICNTILKNQPSFFIPEFYMYVFFILTRAVDLFERNLSSVQELKDNLYRVRDTFLIRVRKDGYYIQYLFFLTSVKPFYYISNLKFYRRFYDNIAKSVLALTHFFH
jgi:Glycosyltransferases involved in cell wall biogenesis